MTREDKRIIGLVAVALGYFGANVAWALMKPWVMFAMTALQK
ncbi:hypothetical protein ANRL3_01377 [Anaerolineae bacterium]|nr:hypothetical protein ANRL3_01377 [Anaerolineae bacterium]